MSKCGTPDCYVTELHTHATGTDGIIGQVCQHGSLVRSCYTCELESSVQQMQQAWKTTETMLRALTEAKACLDVAITDEDGLDASIGRTAIKQIDDAVQQYHAYVAIKTGTTPAPEP